MKSRTLALLLATAGLLTLSGCATQNRSAVQYDANSASQLQQLTYGRVLELRPVVIDLSAGNAYGQMAIGALIGGALGNAAVGKSGSSSNRIATVTGAAVGGAAGEMTSKAMAKSDGVEITLALEDGRRMALVQQADTQPFQVGQCVKVSFSAQQRVSPASGCSK